MTHCHYIYLVFLERNSHKNTVKPYPIIATTKQTNKKTAYTHTQNVSHREYKCKRNKKRKKEKSLKLKQLNF